MFKLFKYSAEVHRQVYTGGKSVIETTGKSYMGYIKPISPEAGQIGIEKFGKEFAFTTDRSSDIRESDRLVISGKNYRVKAVGDYEGVSIRFKRILLVREDPCK